MSAGSGIVYSQNLTPDAGGTLVVTITFNAQGTNGGDWGSAYSSKVYCTQGGTTVYGEPHAMSTSRSSQTVRGVFSVVAGAVCEVGIYGTISGAVAANWWDVHITAELIKR